MSAFAPATSPAWIAATSFVWTAAAAAIASVSLTAPVFTSAATATVVMAVAGDNWTSVTEGPETCTSQVVRVPVTSGETVSLQLARWPGTRVMTAVEWMSSILGVTVTDTPGIHLVPAVRSAATLSASACVVPATPK